LHSHGHFTGTTGGRAGMGQAGPGRVLGWCAGDNQPNLARPCYRPIGLDFSGPGRAGF